MPDDVVLDQSVQRILCYGCAHLLSRWYGDGTTIYLCALVPGLVVGEAGPWSDESDEPREVKDGCYEPSGTGKPG